jgi:ADP-ribose pyrophosphatase
MPEARPEDQVLVETPHLQMISRNGWVFAQRPQVRGVVAVVAVTEDDRLVLVEQYRPPVAELVIELPAGLAADRAGIRNESLREAAERELFEETGYRAEHWSRLWDAPSSPGLTDEQLTFYLARPAVQTGPGGGTRSEKITVHAVPLKTIDDWLNEQRSRATLVDLKVYAGLYLTKQPLATRPPHVARSLRDRNPT